MTAIASHYVDTSPREEPSGIQTVVAARAKTLHRLGEPNRFMVSAVKRLLEDVSAGFGVTSKQVHSRDRHKSVSQARHAFWWLARLFWGFSFPELGRLIGEERAFDHTTVMSAWRKVQAAVDERSPYGVTVASFIAGPEPQRANGARVYELDAVTFGKIELADEVMNEQSEES